MKGAFVLLLTVALLGQAVAKPSKQLLKRLDDYVSNLRNKAVQKAENKEDDSDGDYGKHVMDTCGIDLASLYDDFDKPVDTDVYGDIIDGAKALTEGFAGIVESDEAGLNALEQELADPEENLEQYIQQHGSIVEGFGQSVETMYTMGYCAMITLDPLRTRMEINGVSGFATDHKCNRVGMLLSGLYMENNWDEDAVAEALYAGIDQLGDKLRSDVRCLMNDVKDFKDFVADIDINPAEMSARQAILAVDAVTGYMMDIGNDAVNLLHSAEIIGDMLNYEGKKTLDKDASNSRKALLGRLQKLRKTLQNFT